MMNQTVNQLIKTFEGFRMAPTATDQWEAKGKQVLADKFDSFVNNNKPLSFVMLGFPFKSTNTRDKVIGVYPDKGEELTMKNFKRFDNAIRSIYTPGVNISFVSDGLIFNDLLGVHDDTVHEYTEISNDMSYDNKVPSDWYGLNSFFSSHNLVDNRTKVMQQFGITGQELQERILYNQDVNFLYRGMIRFMTEELATKSYASSNQREKAAKKLVREMMLRNEAYSSLIRHVFPDHVRLSMHKSVNDGNKYSFQLIDSPYADKSAWHCAIALDADGSVRTMHKKDAIAQGYELVYDGTQPYYFTK